MTSGEAAARGAGGLLSDAYRMLRRLGSGEGPFPGVLVSDGETTSVLRDAEGLAGWGGWAHAGARHIAAPLDLVRRADGHDVLLPWCTEKVAVFLGRRAGQGSALASGEISTLTVSVLRGIAELSADQPLIRRGVWWLTDEGCPVVVLDDGEDAVVGGASLLETVASGCDDRAQRRLLGAIAEGLREHAGSPTVPRRQLDLWETELLCLASPRPLVRVTGESTAERVRPTVRAIAEPVPSSRRGARRRDMRGGVEPVDRGRGLGIGLLDRLIDLCRGAAALGRAMAAWRSARAARPSMRAAETARAGGSRGTDRGPTRRRAPKLAVGIAAAGAVLAVGFLWPGDATGGEATSDPVAHRTAPPESAGERAYAGGSPTLDPTGSSTEQEGIVEREPATDGGPREDDLVQEATELVSSIRECASDGDETCAVAVVPGAGHVVALFTTDGAGEGPLQVVDEYGGAAVMRLAADDDGGLGAGGDRMLVLVRVDEKWLVRDAYDVADQPG